MAKVNNFTNNNKARELKLQITKDAVNDAAKAQSVLSDLVDKGRIVSGNMQLYLPIITEVDTAMEALTKSMTDDVNTLDDIKTNAKTLLGKINRYIDDIKDNNKRLGTEFFQTTEILITANTELGELITALNEQLKLVTGDEAFLHGVTKEIEEITSVYKTDITKVLSLNAAEESLTRVLKSTDDANLLKLSLNKKIMEGKTMENSNNTNNEVVSAIEEILTEDVAVAVEENVTDAVLTNEEAEMYAEMCAYEEAMAMAAASEEYEAMRIMAEVNVEIKNENNEKENETMNTVNEKEVNAIVEEAIVEATMDAEDIVDDCDDSVEEMTEEKAASIIDKVKAYFSEIARFVPEVKDNLDKIDDMTYVEAYVFVRKACVGYVKKFGKLKFMEYAVAQVKKGFGYIKGLLVKLIKKVAKENSKDVLKKVDKAFAFVGGVIKKVAGMLFNATIAAGTAVVKALYGLGKLVVSSVKSATAKNTDVEEDDFDDDYDNEIVDAVVSEMDETVEEAIDKAADEIFAEMGASI